jgi:hypothetical protein
MTPERPAAGSRRMKGRKIQAAEVCATAGKGGLMATALNPAGYVKTEGAHGSGSNAIDGLVKLMEKTNVDVKSSPATTLATSGATGRPPGRQAPGSSPRGTAPEGSPGSRTEAAGPAPTPAGRKTDGKVALAGCPRGQAARTTMSRSGDACNANLDGDVCGAGPGRARACAP